MVLPLIMVGLVVATLFVFKDQIKGFIDDLQKEKSPEEVSKQEAQDERGAIENTTRFIFGEENIDNINAQREANKIAVDKFLAESQTNIDQAIAGINTNLVTAQQNLETFAKESQNTIATSVTNLQKDIDTSIKGTQTAIDDSIKGTQTAIDSTLQGGQDFFGNIFNNIFGGQQQAKPVTTKTPAPNSTAPKVTISPTSTAPDLSFLTPNTSFGSTPKEQEVEQEATTERTGRKRFGN